MSVTTHPDQVTSVTSWLNEALNAELGMTETRCKAITNATWSSSTGCSITIKNAANTYKATFTYKTAINKWVGLKVQAINPSTTAQNFTKELCDTFNGRYESDIGCMLSNI